MSNIKKPFAELYAILDANREATVDELMDQLVPIMESSVAEKSHRVNPDTGNLEVFCYYHKEWEDTTVIEYGSKASNKATRLNTMCKCGVNQWTTQQREAKQQQAQVLDAVASGDIDASEIKDRLAEIEEQRKRIVPREEYLANKDAQRKAKLEAQLAKLKDKAEA